MLRHWSTCYVADVRNTEQSSCGQKKTAAASSQMTSLRRGSQVRERGGRWTAVMLSVAIQRDWWSLQQSPSQWREDVHMRVCAWRGITKQIELNQEREREEARETKTASVSLRRGVCLLWSEMNPLWATWAPTWNIFLPGNNVTSLF